MNVGNGSKKELMGQKLDAVRKTLGILSDQNFRGRVMLDLDGCESVQMKLEPRSVHIEAEKVPRLVVLAS